MVKHKAYVDEMRCLACGACVSVCPQDAILITTGKAYVDKNKCSSCYICVRTCPLGAISNGGEEV